MQPEDDYAQRRLLQLHQHSNQAQTHNNAQAAPMQTGAANSTTSTSQPSQGTNAHKYQNVSGSNDRYLHPNKNSSDAKLEKYTYSQQSVTNPERYAAGDRFYFLSDRFANIPCPERFASGQNFHKETSNEGNNAETSNNNSSGDPIYEQLCTATTSNASGKYNQEIKCSSNTNGPISTTYHNQGKYHSHHTANYNESGYRESSNRQESESSNTFMHQSDSERYLSQSDCFSATNIPYMAPPSPAPCDDRFIPPPPLSPSTNEQQFRATSPHSDCYSNNAFPSPSPNSECYPPVERFIPPPPLSPSPTDHFKNSPKKASFRNCSPDRTDRYQIDRFANSSPKPNDRYHPPSYLASSTPIASNFSDRYVAAQERFHDRFTSAAAHTQTATGSNGRYSVNNSSDRYNHVPNPHSPAERYVPIPNPNTNERHTNTERFGHHQTLERYTNASATIERFKSSDSYQNSERYTVNDRYATLPNPNPERYNNLITSTSDRFNTNERYANIVSSSTNQSNERYIPPNAHTPVERYVPQPNPASDYMYSSSGLHYQDRYLTSSSVGLSPSDRYAPSTGDPYMRRDLGYHHHYRPQGPQQFHQYHPSHFHRIRYVNNHPPPHNHRNLRCCGTPSPNHFSATENYASPGSSSSSSVTSCARGETYTNSMLSPSMRTPKLQCNKHICSGSAGLPGTITTPEYVGASGGRLISSSTPPPLQIAQPSSTGCLISKCGSNNCDVQCTPAEQQSLGQTNSTLKTSHGTGTVSVHNACCAVAAAAAVRRGTQQIHLPQTKTTSAVTTLHNTNQWRATGHHSGTSSSGSQTNNLTNEEQSSSTQHSTVSIPTTHSIVSSSPSPVSTSPPQNTSPVPHAAISQQISTPAHPPLVQRAKSLPAPAISSPTNNARNSQPPRRADYSQSERVGATNRAERPRFARSTSTRQVVKDYIKRETASFFGVDEETEVAQKSLWMERRMRLASRRYGELKEEFDVPYARTGRPRTYYGASAAVPREPREDRPDVLPPNVEDVPDSIDLRDHSLEPPLRRKDSVARLTWTGLSYVVTTLTRHRPATRSQLKLGSRSYPPEEAGLAPTSADSEGLEDDVFFERPPSPAANVAEVPLVSSVDTQDAATSAVPVGEDTTTDARFTPSPTLHRTSFGSQSHANVQRAWKRTARETASHQPPPGQDRLSVGRSRIYSNVLDGALDNSDRRLYGMGWVGRMFGRSIRKSVTHDENIRKQLDDLDDCRPFFTWWVTTVQVLILIISLICYGFGPIGLDLANRSGQVLVTSLSLQQIDYQEPANFWLGPRAADLIHLGAKFAPCMRKDVKIIKEIEKGREKERETACCIRNDDSGCVQSSKADCSEIVSTWKKWSAGDSGPGGRISGSVCGLDPKYCDAPASIAPYEWPDDITKWPICRKMNGLMEQARGHDSGTGLVGRTKDKMAEHMVCEVIGHPCCIGIHGQCRITTREYCDFVRGYFHEEASLCSQVSCMDDVCGMFPFLNPETPDQFYRLFTSLFLHAGILQLIVTIIIQYTLMRDLEKLTGSLRMGIIYIGSGVAGNLASAIFVPYRAEVGPAGAQFGLLACLIVEVLNVWPMLRHPDRALLKLISITLVLFIIGILPWVDNYAHLFGFFFGFLLSYALLPFVSFGPYDREKKIALIWVCLLSAGFLFICLIILFYVTPIYDCDICTYFNCVPLTRNFCASQNINFKREEPVV